jgi:hypothetical protein
MRATPPPMTPHVAAWVWKRGWSSPRMSSLDDQEPVLLLQPDAADEDVLFPVRELLDLGP